MIGIHLGVTLGARSRGGGPGPVWTPDKMFQNGERGILTSSNYLDRQFIESTGSTLVSANDDPVGLALEYHAWVGRTLAEEVAHQPELLTSPPTNGTIYGFDVFSVDGLNIGTAVKAPAGVAGAAWDTGILYPPRTIIAAKVDKTISGGSNPSLRFVNASTGSAAGGSMSISDTSDYKLFVFTDNGRFFQIGGTNTTYNFAATNPSARHIPGFHGQQTTNNARPTYKTAEDGHWLFDGGDDNWLTTYLHGSSGMIAFDGTPVGTSDVFLGSNAASNGNGYLGIDTDGVICGAVGSDGFSVIKDSTGTDRRNTRIFALLKWSAAGVVLKVDNQTVYTGALNGAVNTTVPIRLGARNNNGTAAGFFEGKAKMFYAIDRLTTDDEDTKLFNARIV